jgi:hypothetical protein
MHLSSSRLTLAATDLGRFLACRHLTEGYVGRYDAPSNTTFDRAGVPVGRGNWLISLFRRE